MAIQIRNLSVRYGSHQALRNVTVDLPDGEITAVIGPSGCGKTTFLKCLNRLIDFQEGIQVSGQILVDGVNIYDDKADLLALRKKIGFISQRPYPLPMSIYDNITFAPRIHRLTEAEILSHINGLSARIAQSGGQDIRAIDQHLDEKSKWDLLVENYLRLAGLWEELAGRLHEPAAKLSVGQQQRLALARALAIEPSVILADEPTSALDPVSARLVEKQFKLLKDKYTLAVVTHILRQARRIADHVLFFYLGELVESGPADQFFNHPQNEQTAAYLSGEIS
jgi:phosphate transport system ATP-binding protein